MRNGAADPGSAGTYRKTSPHSGRSRYALGSANTTVSMPTPSHGPSSRAWSAFASVDLPELDAPLSTITRPVCSIAP